jgi:hypothetical protein
MVIANGIISDYTNEDVEDAKKCIADYESGVWKDLVDVDTSYTLLKQIRFIKNTQ